VLIAFKGLPLPGQEGNHKNGDKADNRLIKLEWITHKENVRHRFHTLRHFGLRGGLHNMAKLTDKDIPMIRRLLAEGKLLQREIGELFGVSQPTIADIKTRHTWAHI
jgi:DNA-binding CsgD family transcriptional regulator